MNWKYILMMLAGCSLSLLLIFVAPLIGIRGNWSLFIFVLAMFACHLFMPMHHHSSDESNKSNQMQGKLIFKKLNRKVCISRI